MEEELIIHFDLPYHYISTEELMNYSNSIKTILDNFSKLCFNSKYKPNLFINSLSNGGIVLGFLISCLSADRVIKLIESDTVKSFVTGLTGHDTMYYIEKSGLCLKNLFINFLKKKPEELEQIKMPKTKLSRAIRAKNLFYATSMNNPDNKGFCFDNSHDFIINREYYENYIDKNIENEDNYGSFISDILITSPDSENSRTWKGIFGESKRSKTFYFKDEEFLIKSTKISTNDRIVGQFIKKISGNIESLYLIKVLFCNKNFISNLLSESDINLFIKQHINCNNRLLVGEHKQIEQYDLFDSELFKK